MSLPANPIVIGASTLLLAAATSISMGFFTSNQMPVAGRNVVITGGSQGMGKAAAVLLASQGASVAIIARDQKKLAIAGEEIQSVIDANGSKYPGQKLAIISADLSEADGAQRAISQAEAQLGETEILWCCAGGANPGFFKDYTPAELEASMKTNYWSAVFIAHATLKLMASRPPPRPDASKPALQRKIIFTSSLVALCPVVGYSSYVGAKAALRALTDTLRQECLLYDIGVHCCCPGGILTPGFENENLTKPDVTKKIEEEDDKPQTPEQVALICLNELQRGETLPITTFLARAARAGSIGPTPRVGFVFEVILSWIAAIVFIFVRKGHDAIVIKERKAKGLPWEQK
ncbi:3-dehydrosphinganine reductase [Orbilia ellipsospora]|uniref:3-dehydrosphinganine reductase n=1 Tax=Orbilia ellipsospora TaxID=2528407 RepID=A0AAV9WZU4_9PEZI